MGSQKRSELVSTAMIAIRARTIKLRDGLDKNVAILAVNGNWMQFKKSTWFKGGTGSADEGTQLSSYGSTRPFLIFRCQAS